MRILHVINPVKVDSSSDLYLAQPVTFESMKVARDYSIETVEVGLMACHYAEDEAMVPDYFDKSAVLSSSVQDKADFNKPRKLPLIQEIFQLAFRESFDYLIYTNVDIGLMPWFYSVVTQRIRDGIDAMIINRRTISNEVFNPAQLELLYAQAGASHPGMDCFVMSREIVENLFLADICIGASMIGKALKVNLITLASRFEHFTDDHLTFHIGDDRVWKNSMLDDYGEFNKIQLKIVIDALLIRAEEAGQSQSVDLMSQYLNRIYGGNEGSEITEAKSEGIAKPSLNVRIKRSIGALLGKT